MLNRETIVCSRNILISAVFAVVAMSLSPVYAQEPSALTDKTTCLVKYNTLSPFMCDKKNDTLIKDMTTVISPSPSPTPVKKETPKDTVKENPIREMKGVKKTYIYTDRVNKDKAGIYTRLREKADVTSEKGEILRPGDKVRVLKVETIIDKKDKTNNTEWYFVQIFKSYKPELEGKEGWIESWIVEDSNVPEEPTPSPTEAPEVKGESSNSGGSATTSGEGEELFNKINAYRTSNGLAAFEKSERLCSIARERAPEVAGEVATGTVHAGHARRGLGYPVAVENEVGYGNIEANFNWWVNSSLHRSSILGPDLKYSCLECTNGNCVQEFSPNP